MRASSLIKLVILGAVLAAPARTALAHVGSPDVFYEGKAGPYALYVTVRPPEVIPGVADLQIRAADPDIERLRVVPLPLSGDGAVFAPTPDLATRDKEDPQTFGGHLWMMTAGSWQVRILVDGKRGSGELAVPVPTLPQRTAGMQAALGLTLLLCLLVLIAGLISIVGASSGEAQLPPGAALTGAVLGQKRRAQLVAAALIGLCLWGGARWWREEAGRAAQSVYRPLGMDARVDGGTLTLQLQGSGWQEQRLDDLLPDHDHLMHLFMLHEPELEQVFHLHPSERAAGLFTVELPTAPAGRYRLFADVVHATGVPETLVAELTLPAALPGVQLGGDDAAGRGPPLREADPTRTSSPLSGGAQLVWLREPGPLTARTPTLFRFRVEAPAGQPATDLQLYMGMLGHAAFVKRDGSVFAHVHPSGSVPMATLGLVAGAAQEKGGAGPAGHAGHQAPTGSLPAEVGFPYGFPGPGDYRIFVQLKRGGRIETGVFDAHVVK